MDSGLNLRAPRNDEWRGMRSHSRAAFAPSSADRSAPDRNEGAGKAGCLAGTHGPRAKENARGGYHRYGLIHPAFPARWCYGLYELSPGTGVFAPVTSRDAQHLEKLGLSTGRPGPHDFTVREAPLVRATRSAHGRSTSTAF